VNVLDLRSSLLLDQSTLCYGKYSVCALYWWFNYKTMPLCRIEGQVIATVMPRFELRRGYGRLIKSRRDHCPRVAGDSSVIVTVMPRFQLCFELRRVWQADGSLLSCHSRWAKACASLWFKLTLGRPVWSTKRNLCHYDKIWLVFGMC
jgi:hypothetical protein